MGQKHNTVTTLSRVSIVLLIAAATVSCRQSAPIPVTLNYLRTGWIRQNELPAIDALQQKFTRETGLGLRHLHGVQEETIDQLTLTRELLQQGSSGPDVLEIDVTWLGVLQKDLIDLRPYLAAEISSIGPGLASSYIVDGKVVAIPYQNNGGMLVYRADLLREYGYLHPPATWEELEKMATRIQAGERAKGSKNFWGYVWAGAAAESLTCGALEWQMSDGGGTIIESDRTVSVNNRAAIRAWQRARHWVGWISPPATPQYLEADARNVFFSGMAAFIREWGGELPGSPRTADQLRLLKWGYQAPIGELGSPLFLRAHSPAWVPWAGKLWGFLDIHFILRKTRSLSVSFSASTRTSRSRTALSRMCLPELLFTVSSHPSTRTTIHPAH